MASKPRNFNPDFYYHIYNRAVKEKPRIFEGTRDYQRFVNLLDYYKLEREVPYSQFIQLPSRINLEGLQEERAKIIAFVAMPNHFHLLLKPNEKDPNRLSRFVSDLINGYTRYFNIKYRRGGVIFQGKFKSKEVRDEGSVLQLSRYIHLNPLVSKKANRKGELRNPQDWYYSSYQEWAGFKNPHITNQEEVRFWVNQIGGSKEYREFVEAKIDPNRVLPGIEDLIIEETPN
ncbi:MAG: transposase [Patescibacteria group bacterium]